MNSLLFLTRFFSLSIYLFLPFNLIKNSRGIGVLTPWIQQLLSLFLGGQSWDHLHAIGDSSSQLPCQKSRWSKTTARLFWLSCHPLRTHQPDQPDMEGPIPFIMVVIWLTLLASSKTKSLTISYAHDPQDSAALLPGKSPSLHVPTQTDHLAQRVVILQSRLSTLTLWSSSISQLRTLKALLP